jgi:NAD(P)-dependent dehydrogenase (short-subunit alcohol dehydrogenase family)
MGRAGRHGTPIVRRSELGERPFEAARKVAPVAEHNDRVVLVTGAASGIGRACVERLAAEGAVVHGSDVSVPGDDLPPNATHTEVDVTDEGAVASWVAGVGGDRIDGVVTAAGVAGAGAAHDLDEAEWQRVIGVNLTGTFLVAKHVIARMLEQPPRPAGGGHERGAVVTIASIEGIEGTAGGSCYNASKGGVVLFTKNLAIDYGRQGIRANAICPGFIETPMTAGIMAMDGVEAVKDGFLHEHKLRRFGQPAEIASVAAFLLSQDASFLSGVALPVDGAYTAGRDHHITELMGL